MLKGEIYAACALLCLGLGLFILPLLGLHWGLSLLISLVPAVYLARQAAKLAEKNADK